MDRLHHLALADEWEAARAVGQYERSTIGRSLAEEGFIHCSTPAQVEDTADRYYAGRTDVVLLTIDPGRVEAPIRYETAANGQAYPHIYGPLPVAAVTAAEPVPCGADGTFSIDLPA